jgi:hypothetical protein
MDVRIPLKNKSLSHIVLSVVILTLGCIHFPFVQPVIKPTITVSPTSTMIPTITMIAADTQVCKGHIEAALPIIVRPHDMGGNDTTEFGHYVA